MERWPGFTGTSYVGESQAAAFEQTVNYYQETPEVPNEQKQGPWLYPTPGLAEFGANPPQVTGRARGKLEFNGAAWCVNGTDFCFIAANGGLQSFGTVVDDGLPVTMCAGKPSPDFASGQIAIASGGHLYIYDGGTFNEVPIGDDFFGADCITWLDGYFIALQRRYSQFQISALNNGALWNGADVSGTLGQADKIQMCIADKEYLYLLGGRRGEIWYNSGNAGFPFQIESGAFIEDGIGANNSLCQSNNSIYWLDQSARGGVSAVRSEGLITRRVSTHAIERAWSNKNPNKGKVYSTVADCLTYSFIWKGHTCIKWIFPTADASWLYDATESDKVGYPVWTESTFTDADGETHACLERDHCYAYGLHILGAGPAAGAPGVVYTFDDSTYYDAPHTGSAFAGFPIVRDRIVRLPWNGGLRQFFDGIEFAIQSGVGIEGGQGANPVMLLRISRDGGKTWGPEKRISIGKGGDYGLRATARLLGSYRDGAIWVRITDPVFAALIGAQTYIRPGVS